MEVRMNYRSVILIGMTVAGAVSCSDSDPATTVVAGPGAGGSAGTSGAAGSGGSAGMSGAAGAGGSAGTSGIPAEVTAFFADFHASRYSQSAARAAALDVLMD